MSEYIGVSVLIGGKLDKRIVPDFIKLIEGEVSDGDADLAAEIDDCIKEKRHFRIDGTANFGRCDEILEFCKRERLHFQCQSDAKYEYDAELIFWKPGMTHAEHRSCNQTGKVLQDFPRKNMERAMLKFIKEQRQIAVILDKDLSKRIETFLSRYDQTKISNVPALKYK